MTRTSGALLFARYAYPPNALGYCGPADHPALLGYGASGGSDGALRELAKGFEGAWPYLELIARANRIADPLDSRVVGAYWVGNSLLERVGPRLFAESLSDRFRHRAGRAWERLVEPLGTAAVPHHSFHVFAVYPWVGLMRSGSVDEPLRVIDRCRIRWGRVEAVLGDQVVVRSRQIVWRDGKLELDTPRREVVRAALEGKSFATVRPGDVVSMHWDWLCDRLTPVELAGLVSFTARNLAVINAVRHPAPAAVLT